MESGSHTKNCLTQSSSFAFLSCSWWPTSRSFLKKLNLIFKALNKRMKIMTLIPSFIFLVTGTIKLYRFECPFDFCKECTRDGHSPVIESIYEIKNICIANFKKEKPVLNNKIDFETRQIRPFYMKFSSVEGLVSTQILFGSLPKNIRIRFYYCESRSLLLK